MRSPRADPAAHSVVSVEYPESSHDIISSRPSFDTAGGRVLDVTALAPTIAEARARAYAAVADLSWPGLHARADIASSPTEEVTG